MTLKEWTASVLILGAAACGSPDHDESQSFDSSDGPSVVRDGAEPIEPRRDETQVGGPTSGSTSAESSRGALSRTYEGDGFTLRVPVDAELATSREAVWDRPGMEIRGPVVRRSDGYESNAWLLLATTYANPTRMSVDAWVDSVRTEWNVGPFDPDSLGFLWPPDTVRLGDNRALRLVWFCGDCVPFEYFLAREDKVVGLYYVEGGLEAWPRAVHSGMVERIIHTFRWH